MRRSDYWDRWRWEDNMGTHFQNWGPFEPSGSNVSNTFSNDPPRSMLLINTINLLLYYILQLFC